MKKRVLTIIMSIIICNIAFATGIPLGKAINNLPIMQENDLQIAIDNMDIQNASSARVGAENYAKILRNYHIEQTKKEEVELNIAKAVTVDKMRLANKIKAKQYLLTENISMLAFRQLYMAVLAAEGDVELKRMLYAEAKTDYLLAEKQLQAGDITKNEFELKKIALGKADRENTLANTDFQEYKEKLNIMAGAIVEIAPETARMAELQPLGYYKAGAKNRITVQVPLIQNQIIDLELPFYRDKYALNSKAVEDAAWNLRRDYKLNALTAEAAELAAEKNIEMAYFDVVALMLQVQNLAADFSSLKQRVVQMENLYQEGQLSEKRLMQTKIQLKKLENAYKLSSFNLNTKRQALIMATSVGPDYQEVGK